MCVITWHITLVNSGRFWCQSLRPKEQDLLTRAAMLPQRNPSEKWKHHHKSPGCRVSFGTQSASLWKTWFQRTPAHLEDNNQQVVHVFSLAFYLSKLSLRPPRHQRIPLKVNRYVSTFDTEEEQIWLEIGLKSTNTFQRNFYMKMHSFTA